MAKGHIAEKNGIYYCVIPVRDPVTKKNRRVWKRSGNSKREAEKLLVKLLHEMNTSGGYIEPSKMTVGEYLGYWLEKYARKKTRKNTYNSYENFIRVHIIPGIGHIPLSKLLPIHIEDLLEKKLESGRADGKPGGLSSRSVHYIYSILHEALEYAVDKEMLARNPAQKVKSPRLQKKKAGAWTVEEIRKFLATAQGTRFYVLYVLALVTGMRRGELLALCWRDIEFRDGIGIVKVKHTLSKQRTLEMVKTEESERPIVITQEMVSLLKQHRLKQKEERLAAGPEYQDNDLIFCTKIGTPLNAENVVKRHFYPLVKEAGISRITFHGLRHCNATLSLEGDSSLKIVQKRLGHTTIKTTGDIYTHPEVKAQIKVAAVINEVIFGK